MATQPKSWFHVKAKAESAEVLIYDEIGGWGISAKDFIDSINPHKGKPLTVRINSPGGSVLEGFAIYNYLKGFNATVKIDGIAASMASVIAMAGKRIEMAENSFLMIHNPSGLVWGNAEEMRETAEVLDKLGSSIALAYQRRSGKGEDQVKAWMSDETWFSAREAKECGLCDDITEEIAISANLNLSKFSKPPTALRVDSKKESSMADNTSPEKSIVEKIKALVLGESTTAPTPINFEAKAQELETQLAEANLKITEFAALQAKFSELETAKAKADSELKAANEKLGKFDAEVAAKALQITSAQGQPPIAPKTENATAAPKAELRGLDRVVAAFKAQSEAKNLVTK
jgi:ATP-dependent Clp endopeptidase proteolytic subunit ClpP